MGRVDKHGTGKEVYYTCDACGKYIGGTGSVQYHGGLLSRYSYCSDLCKRNHENSLGSSKSSDKKGSIFDSLFSSNEEEQEPTKNVEPPKKQEEDDEWAF